MQTNLFQSSELAQAAQVLLGAAKSPSRSMEDWRYLQWQPNFSSITESRNGKYSLADFSKKGLDFNGNKLTNGTLPSNFYSKSDLATSFLQTFDNTFTDTNYLSWLSLSMSEHNYDYKIEGSSEESFVVLNQTAGSGNSLANHTKNLRFDLAEHAVLNCHFLHLCQQANVLENVHFVLRPSAKLNASVVLNNPDSNYYGKYIFHVYKDAELNFSSLDLNAKQQKHEIHVFIHDEGAKVNLEGAYCLNDKAVSEKFIRVHHLGKGSESKQYYKGILADSSRAIFDGKIYVAPGADQTNAEQLNKNLLLSSKAEVDTKPQLEIFADDVKCSHGATISRFDADEIFYFQARAIDEKTAVDMLARGFLKDAISRIENREINAFYEQLLSTKIATIRDAR